MAYESVLSPLQLGEHTLRNRVTTTAHMSGYAEDGLITDTLIDYLRGRARGGVGMIVTEAGTVHPSYRPASFRYFKDGVVDGLAALADAVHAEGTVLIGQANHGGAASPILPEGVPALSASDNDGINGAPAREITRDEIAEIQAGFVHAASVLVEAGVDGCEVHGAHHYLVNHFLSPLYNRREDEYGGSFDNRLRFVEEILRSMRENSPKGFLLGIRMSADVGPGGVGPDEMLDIGTALQSRGLIDYVTFSLGGRTPESFPLMTGAMERDAGYELEYNEKASRGLSLPTIITGRYRTLAQADAAIAAGEADLVGMTRAHIADPEIVVKTMRGTPELVRACIGCNECVRAIITQGSIRCAVNPALPAGHGTDAVPAAAAPRRVVVLGGGPAGMEAARVAALAGHDVTLLEAGTRLGGLARRAAEVMPNAPGMGEGVEWTILELTRHGVDVRLGTVADLDTVSELKPDVVIAATGSNARHDGRQMARPGQIPDGFNLPHVISSREAIELSPAQAGVPAVVVDELGDYEALGVAEYILASGGSVSLVTPFAAMGGLIEFSGRPSLALARMRPTGRLTVHPLSMLTAITPTDATVEEVLGHTTVQVPATLVVMVTRAAPNRPDWLTGLDIPVEFVGDAIVPRSYKTAVAEGHRAAAAIS